jgi:hypothetical protein
VSLVAESIFIVDESEDILTESEAILVAESADAVGEAEASAPLLLQAAIATATAMTANTFLQTFIVNFLKVFANALIVNGRKTNLFLLLTKEKSNRDALEIKVFP